MNISLALNSSRNAISTPVGEDILPFIYANCTFQYLLGCHYQKLAKYWKMGPPINYKSYHMLVFVAFIKSYNSISSSNFKTSLLCNEKHK